jgi:membrane protein DedA with SNARE-associated domain
VDLPALIETHGYWVLVLGCLLEGETVLLLAGFAAHRGHLDLSAVMVIAALAGFTGDQGFFWLGRRHGAAVLGRWPAIAQQAGRLNRLIERWRDIVVVLIRFAWGLRIAGPILIGMSTMPGRRFALFNAIGAVIWAVLVAGTGWAFGHMAQQVLERVQSVEALLLLAAGMLAAVIGAARWWRRRRSRPR